MAAFDTETVVPLTEQPNVMVVEANAPFRTLGDLVAAAKAKPGTINIGHAGIGSGTHLSTEKFIAGAGVKVVEVPFKGTPEVVAAILSHNVDGYWAPISAAIPFVKGGKVVGREGVTIIPQADVAKVQKDTPPHANSSKVETLKGGDYVRLWINKGGNHYLVHFTA